MVQTGPPARGGTVLRTLWVSASEATLGRSAPLPRLPGGGPHFSREMGRKRAGPSVIGRWLRWNRCRVDPATWVPRRLRRGSPAFFGRKPEERTPGRREVLSALDPPLSGLRSERVFFYIPRLACGPVSYARNGPPTSWAGWERQEFWDPLRWAPKIGGCTPTRASEAGTLGVRSMFWPAEPVKT